MTGTLKILKLLSDPTRLRILRLVGQEGLTVAELQQILGMGQSRTSAHLAQLKAEGLVADRRAGKNIYYTRGGAVPSAIAELIESGGEELPDLPERIRAIEVIRIDRGKRCSDRLARAPDGVCGAPWLGSPSRGNESSGQIVELLESVGHGQFSGVARTNFVTEVFFDFAADEENHAVESGPDGIVHGVVEEGLAGGSDGVELFESAIAGAHTGGEDEKGG